MHFKVIETLEPNKEILDTLTNYTYKVTNGSIKKLPHETIIFILIKLLKAESILSAILINIKLIRIDINSFIFCTSFYKKYNEYK